MKLTVAIETANNPLNKDFLEGTVVFTCNQQKIFGNYFFNYRPKNLFDQEAIMDLSFVFESFQINCTGKYRDVLKDMTIRNNMIWSYIAPRLNDNIQKINQLTNECKVVVNTAEVSISLEQYLILFDLAIKYGGS